MAQNQFSYQSPVGQFSFPQPQGSIYLINNSLEVANVPASSGINAALCMAENLLYLKTIQNGQPMFLAFTIAPYETHKPQTQLSEQILEEIKKQNARIEGLEKILSQKGGLNEQSKSNSNVVSF